MFSRSFLITAAFLACLIIGFSGCMRIDSSHTVMPESGSLSSLAAVIPGRTYRSSSSAAEWRNTNEDARVIEPGQTLEIANLQGPGVINHIWSTMVIGELFHPRLLVIRMYWDGSQHPSVECPLGDFFGVGFGLERDLHSKPINVGSHGRARNCYWKMPFRESARITITNEGRKAISPFFWYVDWQQVPSLPDNAAYFHAMYRQEHPARPGNYVVADIEGEGQYVGTLLNIHQKQGSWWGEGDDFFFIDGEKEPSLRGTGSEDYLCDAWGVRLSSYPEYGTSVFEYNAPDSRTSSYRWHISDPVSFDKSLRFEIEHKGVVFDEKGELITHFGERDDDFSSVAFWYQRQIHKPFPPLPPAYDRIRHDPDNVIEAESLLENITVRGGKAQIQYGPWSGARQVRSDTAEPGQELELEFEVEKAGLYTLSFYLTKATNYGIYTAYVNGNAAGKPMDLYTESFHTRGFILPNQNLAAGKNKLTLRNTGKNGASTGYGIGIDCIVAEKKQ
ncbi:hypothetical protein SMSP2_01922 [Limihaloglobus sulfuriphilus]|uniref:DUF2961 domain-containing protein n=2 Tax=Limihaloglobus sulfuriphilus TaxID=1851148 RepID=A0A1Q2MGW0_9BACT|nr:hypothetical protein SMSP2_01922 [Limihaloglobus sulfuriphilus]